MMNRSAPPHVNFDLRACDQTHKGEGNEVEDAFFVYKQLSISTYQLPNKKV